MLSLIRSKYMSTSTSYRLMDAAHVIMFFTLDAISDVAFGKSFGFLHRDEDAFGYTEQIKSMLPAMMMFGVYPELHRILRLPYVQKLLPKATDAVGLGRVMGFARDVVAERFPTMGKATPQVVRKDMLGSFKDNGLTQDQLESETLIQITAGSDTTATTIRMALFHIVTNPECEKRLLDELTADGYGPPNHGGLDVPTLSDAAARNLPYLQACIKESLRMYPPVTGLLSKQVPDSGESITVHYRDGSSHDLFVPGGTRIGWNPYGMMRSMSTFGADADVWRPERWLEYETRGMTAAQLREMNDTVSLVFGYGRFGCLGRPVAMLELNKAIPELVRRFKWQVARPEKPWTGICAGYWLHDDMDFVVTERTA